MWQISKKFICISFLLLFSLAYLHAASPKNITLSIQGSGSQNFVDGFKNALTVEAKAAGYQVTDDLDKSKYNIKFTVEFDRIEQKSKFVVSLIKVADSSVIVTMEYFFADEEEMLLYGQLVFFMLMSNLPEDVTAAPEDDSWRNKWLYFNISFDYSLMFMALQPEGLIGGIGVYDGEYTNPTRVGPLDNKIVPTFGIGFGIEFQFLNFMSIEPHAQIFREEIKLDNIMYNALFSVKLNFPLKFLKSLVITPYGIAAYSMRFPENEDEDEEIFDNYPEFIFGGGIQFAVKAGKSGAIFFDVSYMYVNDDLKMKNQFRNTEDPKYNYYPEPEFIHYNNFNISFSIGYKFGLFNRKR